MPARRVALALLALLVGGRSAVFAPAEVSKEYQLKAAFLYNFTKFVEWPAPSWLESKSPIVLGVFGGNPFGASLEQAVQGRSVNGHPLIVRTVTSVAEARSTHLLFVAAGVSDQDFRELQTTVAGLPVLTVGETTSFAKLGGMITFVLQENKIRFEINVAAAQRSGLKISAQLQKLATAVR